MDGDGSHRKALSLAFLISILLAVQTLGTMATTMLPAVAPKVAETYGVHSSLIGYARASVMSSTIELNRVRTNRIRLAASSTFPSSPHVD